MSDHYLAFVERKPEDSEWIIKIPQLEAVTQARLGEEEIDEMTQDLIAIMTDQEGPFRVLYEFV